MMTVIGGTCPSKDFPNFVEGTLIVTRYGIRCERMSEVAPDM